jgi:hypothetical protein
MDPKISQTNYRMWSKSLYETTQHNIPEDSHLHTSCHENLKSHEVVGVQHAKGAVKKAKEMITETI